jgi:mannose-6-phosphate isomerase
LHSTQPEFYKDANHKPEMSVALTPFDALCGFRPLPEIQAHLKLYPELADIVGAAGTSAFYKINSIMSNMEINSCMNSHTEGD